jgi:hypothetical protein
MGNTYHPNAKTTSRIRKEIQDSKESVIKTARRLNLNPKTVQKWRTADRVVDKRSGSSSSSRSVLSTADQSVICEFRRVTQFSLDDVFIALKDKIPGLTRSNLHRCLVRNNMSVLPKETLEKPAKQEFKKYPIGYVHIDITQLLLEGGVKLYLFVGICRVSKYVYYELHENMNMDTGCKFLEALIIDFPFTIHRILTDNGAQFTYELLAEHLRPKNKKHPFDEICEAHKIKHKLTKFRHPWTNGQVEVFNKTVKNATTKKYHYENIDQLKQHLMSYLLVHNFQKKLKALKFLTPYEYILQIFEKDATLFKGNPIHKIVGLSNYSCFKGFKMNCFSGIR